MLTEVTKSRKSGTPIPNMTIIYIPLEYCYKNRDLNTQLFKYLFKRSIYDNLTLSKYLMVA